MTSNTTFVFPLLCAYQVMLSKNVLKLVKGREESVSMTIHFIFSYDLSCYSSLLRLIIVYVFETVLL